MARYTNIKNALMMFNRFFNMCENEEQKTLVLDMKQAFLELPTADRGKWGNIMFTQRYRCSLCGNEIYFGKDKFCSECGAKMDGTAKERGGANG